MFDLFDTEKFSETLYLLSDLDETSVSLVVFGCACTNLITNFSFSLSMIGSILPMSLFQSKACHIERISRENLIIIALVTRFL